MELLFSLGATLCLTEGNRFPDMSSVFARGELIIMTSPLLCGTRLEELKQSNNVLVFATESGERIQVLWQAESP